MPNIRMILTGDGSHSLLNAELDETYHSRHGAVQESEYVFIEQGLKFWLKKNKHQQLTILEVGLGTALNAWLTFSTPFLGGQQVNYFAIETYPLASEVWQHLNYATHNRDLFEKIHTLPWNDWHEILPLIRLFKHEGTLQEVELPDLNFDLIYYDAFAPSKQPEMWMLDVINKVVMKLRAGGVFVTYCAKGQLKRDLKALGLEVESLPGPPGKREMIRAIKL